MKTGSAVRRMLGRKKMSPSARINNSYGVSDYEKELPHPTRNLTVSRVVIMLNSFEVELPVPALVSQEGGPETCRAVFIRAPAIVDVGASVELLAEYPLVPGQGIDAPEQKGGSKDKVVVAVKQNNMLATAFHPELTSDLRWHSFFMKMISSEEEGAQVPGTEGVVAKKADLPQALSQVRDMPVFKEASFLSLELQ